MKALMLITLIFLSACGGVQRPGTPSPATPPQQPAPNPDPKPNPDPDSNPMKDDNPVSWEAVSNAIFKPKCIFCHNPKGELPSTDLSSYVGFISNENLTAFDPEHPERNTLIDVITDEMEPMPPARSGQDPLNDEEIELIFNWLKAGAPE